MAQLGALGSFDGAAAMEALTMPALVVHGTHDRVLPHANALALVAALPDARLLTLEGHGHLWTHTHESAVRSIDRFLLDVDAGKAAGAYAVEPSLDNYL